MWSNFFQGLFTGEEAAKDSYFWGNLTATLCDLHPKESMATIREAFDKGIVTEAFIAMDQVEQAESRTMDQAMEDLATWVNARMPADVHNYISWFSEFQQEDRDATEPKGIGKGKGKPKKTKKKKKGKK